MGLSSFQLYPYLVINTQMGDTFMGDTLLRIINFCLLNNYIYTNCMFFNTVTEFYLWIISGQIF